MRHAPRPIRPRKFTREISYARKVARDYFKRYPKDLYETEVESWADIQSYNIEFDEAIARTKG
jgi:hypothetical protein